MNSIAPGPMGPARIRDWDTRELVEQMRSEEDERYAATFFPRFYDTPSAYLRKSTGALDAYGRTLRAEGPFSAVLLALFATGAVLGRGRARRSAVLFFTVAFGLQLTAVATLYYDVRYPTYGFLAAAGALAVEALLERRRGDPPPRLRR